MIRGSPFLALILVWGVALDVAAQSDPATHGASDRRALAVRINGAVPEIDGRLDDPVWGNAQPATGFMLREPTEGVSAPERTEVRFLYGEDALYIGARMAGRVRGDVRAIVARRDREPPSERLIVSLDTRGDRLTAYTFAITPGGVRVDYFHPGDSEGSRDYSFDPVWRAAVAVDDEGWTAEIRIPFTQLRYNPGAEQSWGLNLVRHIPDRNEIAYWALVRRTETGWASRMGTLDGLRDLPASRRMELAPYLAANGTRAGSVDPDNPFADRYETGLRAGGDLKMGLGPNLTLEATFNPDFGQVEADPAEVNLSAFETFFSERRPFFTEGRDLFGGRGTFYSRRIGAPPPGDPEAPYSESADNSTILGAAKLIGRLPSGLSLGALAAVTDQEEVRTHDPGADSFGRTQVAPLSGYGIVTARQEFGRNRSTVSGTLTAVERDLDAGSPLAQLVAERAYTGVVDTRIRWAGGGYDMSAYLGFSHVAGDPAAILGLQRSSRRYFQRPDADHVEVDPDRTALNGIMAGINHSKLAGNLRWDIDYYQESPGLELNDIGSLGAGDDRGVVGDIQYEHTTPGRLFHDWHLGLFGNSEWNFGGVRTGGGTSVFGGARFRNFMEASFEVFYQPSAASDNQTRGGPLMATPSGVSAFAALSSRSGASTQWNLSFNGHRNELDGWSLNTNLSVSARLGTRWEVSASPRIGRSVSPRQYVATRSGGSSATFGGRYIFAEIERSEVVARLRANFALTPDLTLEGYVEPFASSGRFRAFGELAAPRTFDLREYGGDGTTISRNEGSYVVTDGASEFGFSDPDFDVRSLRSNLVLRWEWTPGSTLFLVWQQNRFENGLPTGNVGPGGLFDAFGAPGDHFLALKVSYWIPVR